MTRTPRTLVAAVAIGAATALAAAPAGAAPAKSVQTAKAAKAKKAKVTKAKAAKVVRAIRVQNRRYLGQRVRVAACARPTSAATPAARVRAKRTLSSSAKLRSAALRGVNTRAGARALRAKHTRLKRATKQLRTTAAICSTGPAKVAAPSAAPAAAPATAPPPHTVTIIVPGPAAAPVTGPTADHGRPADGNTGDTGNTGQSGGSGQTGAPGQSGGSGQTGSPGQNGLPGQTGAPGDDGAPGAPDGAVTADLDLSLGQLLGDTPIDLSGVLGPGGTLPATLGLAGLDQALDGALGAGGLVGIDAQALLSLLNQSVVTLTTCAPLLDLGCLIGSVVGTVNGLLTQVTGLLDGGAAPALGDILRIERVSDTALRLVPIGPLAKLIDQAGGVDKLLGGITGPGLTDGLLRLN